ncbi:MAG TPA: transglycosylase SLT domain-containing protein [Gemmatimonadaceae bacterium]|nr:transglycosylase SLT domain-containing protein [Gemmatimonadaceae bacterium]
MHTPLRLLLALAASAACAPAASSDEPRTDSSNGAVANAAAHAAAPRDSLARAADAMLAAGRPWAAYRVVAPALADSARRSPSVVLAAARAAAGWGGWNHVEELLRDAPWADTAEHGAAHELLARAALANGRDSSAALHADRAVELAATGAGRGARRLLRARAFDRLKRLEPSRADYLAAANDLPVAADWLRLRAAALTPDSAARAALYRAVREPAARAHIARTEAGARERTEDFAGAARAFAALGARGDALRAAALHAVRTAGDRDSLRAALLAPLSGRPGTDEARVAAELLDQWFSPLSPPDELLIARSLARSGPLGRAADGFARAARAGLLTPEDRFAHGRTLARLNRDRAAAAEYAQVAGDGPLAAAAAYQRGRALLALGDVAGARRVLRDILDRFPRDTSAGMALYLLADLATDEGRDTDARAAYRDGVRRFPTVSRTARARFLAAMIAYTSGNYATAAREWDALAEDDPRGPESLASAYWSGRAWSRAGNAARARERWSAIARTEPASYYAFAAERRLGNARYAPFPASAVGATPHDAHPALSRALRLEALDLDFEARLEYAYLERLARQTDSLSLLEAARQLVAADRPYRAIPLAAAAVPRADDAARVEAYRALYPAPLLDVIVHESRRNGIDPSLFAALVRQESWYNPRATSGAGARGFAQVMPSVGRAVARSLRFPHWDSALLYEPEASVMLGAAHLAASLRRYEDETRALAAYNAGQSRVQRWNRKAGTNDPEVFIERIPFVETRDYVRIVLRNREIYRALYPALRPE